MSYDFWELMLQILRDIAELRTPFWDAAISLLTKLGEETVAIVLICAVYWCISKRLAYGVGFGYFMAALSVQGMKVGFRIERPWVLDPNFQPVEAAIKHATGYSFPSGHTQSATSIFGGLAFMTKKKWFSFICIALALGVAFSRLYLGVHTLLDVGVGFLISIIMAAIFTTVFKSESLTKKGDIIIGALLLAASVGVIAYAFGLYQNGFIEYKYVSDCCKGAGAAMGFAAGFLVERTVISFSEKTKNIWLQLLKFTIGLAVLLGIKSGLKMLLGESLPVDTLRYFLMIFWVLGIWPLFIKRFFQVRGTAAEVSQSPSVDSE